VKQLCNGEETLPFLGVQREIDAKGKRKVIFTKRGHLGGRNSRTSGDLTNKTEGGWVKQPIRDTVTPFSMGFINIRGGP